MINWVNAEDSDKYRLKCISLALKNHSHLLKFILDEHAPRLSMPAERILREMTTLSKGEQLLIRVALDFWSGEGKTQYISLIYELSKSNLQNVLQATMLMGAI